MIIFLCMYYKKAEEEDKEMRTKNLLKSVVEIQLSRRKMNFYEHEKKVLILYYCHA